MNARVFSMKVVLMILLKATGARYDETLKYNRGEECNCKTKFITFFAKKIHDINDICEIQEAINDFYKSWHDILSVVSNNNFKNITFNIRNLDHVQDKDSFDSLLKGALIYKIN